MAAYQIEPVDTGTLRGDLIESYCGTGGLTDKPEVAAFGAILTAIMRDPEFAAAFRRDVVAPKLAASKVVFQRAIERGEINPGVDIELLAPADIDACVGAGELSIGMPEGSYDLQVQAGAGEVDLRLVNDPSAEHSIRACAGAGEIELYVFDGVSDDD